MQLLKSFKGTQPACEKTEQGFSRRSFIRSIGLATGAAAVAPIFPGTIGTAVARNVLGVGGPIRIGMILDHQNAGSSAFMKGFQLYLNEISGKAGGAPIELVTEEFGNTANGSSSIAEKLIYADKVSLVIVLANSRIVDRMREAFDRAKVPLIEASAGEVIPSHASAPSSVFRSSLNLWQSHAALGGWAAQTIGKRAAMALSFYNAGFDLHRAFRAGFEQAGGEIVQMVVTGSADGKHPFEIMEPIKAMHPDFVYGGYSNYDALVFASAYASAGIDLPLLGMDVPAVQHSIPDSVDLRTASSWFPTLNYEANARFRTAYHAFTGTPAGSFAALGYDTARLALTAASAAGSNGTAIAQALSKVRFQGLRGETFIDGATRSIVVPLYLASYGSAEAPIELTASAEAHEILYHQNATALSGGWLNSYHIV